MFVRPVSVQGNTSGALMVTTDLKEIPYGFQLNVKGGLRYIRGTRRAVTEATYKKAIVTVKAGERIEQV